MAFAATTLTKYHMDTGLFPMNVLIHVKLKAGLVYL
jgi:hypothetical protein